MLTHLGLLVLNLLPQVPDQPGPNADPISVQVDPATSLRVVSAVGVLRPEGLDPRFLGLGDGGFPIEPTGEARVADASRRRSRAAVDPNRTPGGAYLQVLAEGVKVTLPNGHELLVGPRGRVHLRDGGFTEPAYGGLSLWLGDGSIVECIPGDGVLRSVRLFRQAAARPVTLWSSGRRARRSRSRGHDGPRGRGLAALGDGRSLYALSAFGPVVSARRVVTPRLRSGDALEPEQLPPAAAAIVLGDVLRGSLGQLSVHARTAAAGRPQVHQRADLLAGAAASLFGQTLQRDAAIGDECNLALGLNLRLRIEARQVGRVSVELWNVEGEPIAQWIHTNRTMLHLLEKHEDGSVHYVMPALTIDRRFWNVLPFPNDSATVGDARALLIPTTQPELLAPGR